MRPTDQQVTAMVFYPEFLAMQGCTGKHPGLSRPREGEGNCGRAPLLWFPQEGPGEAG